MLYILLANIIKTNFHYLQQTTLFKLLPAPNMTLGLLVLVHEVMAAIITDP